jgi:flagellar protein FliO/FliZ
MLRLTGMAAGAVALHVRTAAALAATSEDTPLNLGDPNNVAGSQSAGGGGGGIVRTIVGLAIVVAVIWGLSWVLRQVKASREERASGSGLAPVATLPLGPGRSVHVVRVGREVLLLGVSEHQVTRLGAWSELEAEEAGLLPGDDEPPPPASFLPALPSGGASRGAASGIRRLIDALRHLTVRR